MILEQIQADCQMIFAVGDGACLRAVLDYGEAMKRGIGRVHSHCGVTLNRRHASCGSARRFFLGGGWSAETGECFCALEEHQQRSITKPASCQLRFRQTLFIFFREWSAESGECFCPLEEHQQPPLVRYTLANRFFSRFSEVLEREVQRVL